MKFSIIIPVYNVEKYLEQCLNSVLEQTYMDYEVVLINDGSNDKSTDICRKYVMKYQHISLYEQENQGLAYVRNLGVSKARGEYIIFMDSDDFYDSPSTLEILSEKATNVDIVAFSGKYFFENGRVERFSNSNILANCMQFYDSGEKFLLDILSQREVYSWFSVTYAIKREYWEKNMFNFPNCKYEDEALMWYVVLRAREICTIRQDFYFYRKGVQQAITGKVRLNIELEHLQVVENNILSILKLNCDQRLKHLLCDNFSASYYAVLIMTSVLEREEKKILIKELQKRKWVCNYTRSRKQLVAKHIVKVFGVSAAISVFGVRRRIKNIYSIWKGF